jgi:hypothetical protein
VENKKPQRTAGGFQQTKADDGKLTGQRVGGRNVKLDSLEWKAEERKAGIWKWKLGIWRR